jgi:hypothetical protein
MAHNVVELIAAPVNHASCGRHGGSRARPGAASRIVVLELLLGRHPYVDSGARLTGARRSHSGERGD